MAGKMIAEEIEVEFARKPGPPTSFTWRDKIYPIKRVLHTWVDTKFGTMEKGRWWQRRHRTYYHVLTEAGEEFEFYQDRGKKYVWILYRQLTR
jgi:hypothetical protein